MPPCRQLWKSELELRLIARKAGIKFLQKHMVGVFPDQVQMDLERKAMFTKTPEASVRLRFLAQWLYWNL